MAFRCKVCNRSTAKSPVLGGCAGHTTKQDPYAKKESEKPREYRKRHPQSRHQYCSCGALIRNGKCVALDCGKKVK